MAETGSTIHRQTTQIWWASTPDASQTVDSANAYWQATAPNRVNALHRQEVSDGTTAYAIAEFVYDNEYTTGNLTEEKYWDSVKLATAPTVVGGLSTANARVLTRAYNSRGAVTEIYAPDIRTSIVYGSVTGVNRPGPYPTQVTYAPGTTLARVWNYVWNYPAGVLTSSSDRDNSVTTTYVYDAVGRTTEVNEAGLRKTVTTYYDQTRRVRTVSDLATFGDTKLQTITKHDMLGRVIETRVSDGAVLGTTASATDGIRVTTNYSHANGSPPIVVTSTPYRTTTDPTLEWICTAPASCASTANRTGLTQMAYDANEIKTTDPADVVVEHVHDALGRLTQATEDPGTDKLDYDTTYAYDALGNLTTVTQGVQTRTFVYSSLSRLRSARNPESGTTHYCYDDAGNLKSRTDARVTLPSSALDSAGNLICPATAARATATYTYDDLRRPLTVAYSDTPPDVAYVYHTAAGTSGTANIGRLKSVTTTSAIVLYNSYDKLGRAPSLSQTVAGHPDTFTFAATYYLNGALKSQTYPSGRMVSYGVDDAGRATTVAAGTRTYADMTATVGHAYAPDGRLQQMKLGNNLWETRDYRTPGTTTRFLLGTSKGTATSPGASERVALGYNYSGTANNGNLMSHTITRPGRTQPWTQEFTYDALNRLKTAGETAGYSRTFGYDRYGNRWLKSNTGRTEGESHEPRSNVFAAATNRMTTSTVAYDAAGNQIMYSPYTLVYDAENRLKSMTHASSGSGTYLYDGEGRRVKKTWTPGGGTAQDTYYVYDIAGNLAAEYGTGSTSASGTLYPFTDMLGSVRAVTNANGAVIECYDYLPFGRMLSSSDNSRSTSCHPLNPDTAFDSEVSQKFTGQVRDEETRLDYFKARYMSAPEGRFLSADEPFADQWESDPQSWNLYAYVRNNPLSFVDLTGHECTNVFHEDGHVETTCTVTADVLDQSVFELWLFVSGRRVSQAVTEVATTSTRLVEEFVRAPRDPGCMALATGIGVAAGVDVGATIGAGGGFVVGVGVASIATTPAGAVGGALMGAPVGGAVGAAAAGNLLCAQMSGFGGGWRF